MNTNQQSGDDQYFVFQRPGNFLHQLRTILGDNNAGIFIPRSNLQNERLFKTKKATFDTIRDLFNDSVRATYQLMVWAQ